MRKLLLSTAVLSLGMASAVLAHHAGEIEQAKNLVISHAWMHENADMAHSSAVYLTIDNQGTEADRLIGAEVEFADRASFQAQVLSAEGVLAVQDIKALQIEPGQVLTLKPGVAWIELESVQQTFLHGDHFDMVLTFEKAGPVEVEVVIEPVDGDEHETDEDDAAS